MDKHIDEYLAQLLPELARRGITVSGDREIAYGLQLRLQRADDAATLNLYHSAKRGLTAVVGGAPQSLLRQELDSLCSPPSEERERLHGWSSWIGSDECGKGDYFGALVVAAFAMEDSLEGQLRELGVADSKRIRDPQIKVIAKQLYTRYNDRIACVVIKPIKYNEIIADMQSRGQNLNDLLAWQHGAAIIELLPKHPLTEGILVDQFSRQHKVKALLKKREIKVPVEERTGGEADLAVAAASVIARYQFLQSREAMDRFYQLKFPLGASRAVLKPAREFVDRYGLKRLAEVAKLHFVTSLKVQQRDLFPES